MITKRQIKEVSSLRDWTWTIVTNPHIPAEIVYVIVEPLSSFIVSRLAGMGLSVYRPVPESDIYLVAIEPIEGLTVIDTSSLVWDPFPAPDESKPYPTKRKGFSKRRHDDEPDEDDEDDDEL